MRMLTVNSLRANTRWLNTPRNPFSLSHVFLLDDSQEKYTLTLGFYHHYLRHWFETNNDPAQYLIFQVRSGTARAQMCMMDVWRGAHGV